MASYFEFIINAIIDVAQTDRIEGLDGNKFITIEGSKDGFFSKNKIKISIERSKNDPDHAAFVTAQVNSKSQSEDILKEILYDILERTGMLDSKLEMKLDIIFNDKEIIYQDDEADVNFSPNLSGVVILGLNAHINISFPELKDNIEIKSEGKDIVFILKKGLDDPNFEIFFHYGVKLKSAIRNCRTYGVKNLIFIDPLKNEYMTFTIEEMEGMDLH